jgi:hypothetical protein
MTVTLNEKSAMLHDEDHSTGLEFERADEADLYATRTLRKKLQFCRVCFGDNKNTEEAQRLAMLEENFGSEEVADLKRGVAPERVRLEAPASSVHAEDDAVPAGQNDPTTL